jgi:hypothetical protein
MTMKNQLNLQPELAYLDCWDCLKFHRKKGRSNLASGTGFFIDLPIKNQIRRKKRLLFFGRYLYSRSFSRAVPSYRRSFT